MSSKVGKDIAINGDGAVALAWKQMNPDVCAASRKKRRPLASPSWSCAIRRNGRKPSKPVRYASLARTKTSSMPKRNAS